VQRKYTGCAGLVRWARMKYRRLASFKRVSNGGTEAINRVIEKTRRLAHGCRNFDNDRLRLQVLQP
jgi:transposase